VRAQLGLGEIANRLPEELLLLGQAEIQADPPRVRLTA
jgi:hypothetical protein